MPRRAAVHARPATRGEHRSGRRGNAQQLSGHRQQLHRYPRTTAVSQPRVLLMASFRVALSADFLTQDGSPAYPMFDLQPLTDHGIEYEYGAWEPHALKLVLISCCTGLRTHSHSLDTLPDGHMPLVTWRCAWVCGVCGCAGRGRGGVGSPGCGWCGARLEPQRLRRSHPSGRPVHGRLRACRRAAVPGGSLWCGLRRCGHRGLQLRWDHLLDHTRRRPAPRGGAWPVDEFARACAGAWSMGGGPAALDPAGSGLACMVAPPQSSRTSCTSCL
jgi:hypothetical protein